MRAVSMGMRTVSLVAVALLFCHVAAPALAARALHAAAPAPPVDEQLLVTFNFRVVRFSASGQGRALARANADAYVKVIDSAAEVAAAYAIGPVTTFLVRGPLGLQQKLEGLADVALVEVDGVFDTSETFVEQLGSTWGLERMSRPASTTATAPFDYHSAASAGKGIDIYVVDTAILPELAEFEGRACIGYSAFGTVASYECGGAAGSGPSTGPGVDEHEHGTHVAGTCAGRVYGVAKMASIIGVQVLSCSGSGSLSGVLGDLQYAIDSHSAKHGSGTGSVINLSLGGGYYQTMNNAVAAAVNAGIVVVVAAGNSSADAANYSPAIEPSVLTVGAATDGDSKAWFSNYGDLVDVYAPRYRVYSVSLGGAVTALSGTSMASPHVAGLVALLMGSADRLVAGLTLRQIQDYIINTAVGMKNYAAFNAVMINNGWLLPQ